MQLGLSTYAYTWAFGVPGKVPETPMTLSDLVSQAHAYDLPVVQIADNCPLHVLSQEELHDLSRTATLLGVRLEVGMRGLIADSVQDYLDIAKQLGSPVLRLVVDGPGYEPDIDEVIRVVRSLVPRLKKLGIRLAIENHDRFLSTDFVRMVTETDPEWVGICLDSVNSMGAGEGVAEVVRTLAPHTINLHIKEFTVRRVDHKMGFVVEGRPAGQGMLSIPALVRTIAAHGRCRSAIIELWTPPQNTLNDTILKEAEWVASSVSFLKESNLFD
jgi:sugar phosphate isomerase/epimerase